MRVRRLCSIGATIVFVLGCSSMPLPFRETTLVPLEGVDPEKVRQEFGVVLPEAFEILNTVTFHFKGKAFAAIGYTGVDAARRTFTVVGLHPAGGVKLFEVSGDADAVETAFALEEFAIRGDVARAVGDDTRRMYFDRLPSRDARISKERYRIVFRQDSGEGEIEYVFAGEEGFLVEKRYYEGGRRIWTTCYYEYLHREGKVYPQGIILEHHRYGYRVVVRLREIRS